MKNWERFIIYPITVFLIFYSYFTNDKLQYFYKINREKKTFQKTINFPEKPIYLYDFEFEQDIDFNRPNNLPVCRLIWHAWVLNLNPYWIHGFYNIEFKDCYGNIIHKLREPGTFPNTEEPREAQSEYYLPDDIFRRVDFVKSKIYIEIEKLNN